MSRRSSSGPVVVVRRSRGPVRVSLRKSQSGQLSLSRSFAAFPLLECRPVCVVYRVEYSVERRVQRSLLLFGDVVVDRYGLWQVLGSWALCLPVMLYTAWGT